MFNRQTKMVLTSVVVKQSTKSRDGVRTMPDLSVDERRRMAAMFAIFVRVDERNSKSAKRGKSKSSKIKKTRSPTYLGRGPSLLIIAMLKKAYFPLWPKRPLK